MATLENLAEQYAVYLKLNKSNPGAPGEISSRINSLVYTKDQTPLSKADKEFLVNQIAEYLSHKKTSPDGHMLVEAEDSTQFIKMIQMIRNQTK